MYIACDKYKYVLVYESSLLQPLFLFFGGKLCKIHELPLFILMVRSQAKYVNSLFCGATEGT